MIAMKNDLLENEKNHTTKRYFTGKPCLRGHISERLLSTSRCIECSREDYIRLKSEDYFNKRRDKHKAFLATKKWRTKNKQKVRAWVNNRTNRRRSAALIGNLFKEETKQIYLNCPLGYQVDHIIPLNGENVCGLHVPWNLQYLTPEENYRKRNKIVPWN
jgi:hypothetical protein